MSSANVWLKLLAFWACARHGLSLEAAPPEPGRAAGADAGEPEGLLTCTRHGHSCEVESGLECAIDSDTGELEGDCSVRLVQSSWGRLVEEIPSSSGEQDLGGLQPPSAPSFGPGSTGALWRYVRLPLAVASLVTIPLLIVLKWCLWSSSPVEAARCVMKGAHFVVAMGFSICILDSYRMAKLLSMAPGQSGLIVGFFCNGHAVGVLVSWSFLALRPSLWRTQARPIIVGSAVMHAVGCAMYLSCTELVYDGDPGQVEVTLPVAIYAARFAMGLPSGVYMQWIGACFKSVYTRQELSVQMGHVLSLVAIGIGVGPMVAAASLALTPSDGCLDGCPDSPGDISAPAAMQLVFAVGALAAALTCFPRSEDLPQRPSPSAEEGSHAPSPEQDVVLNLSRSQRTVLVGCCIGIFVLRCFVMAGVETGSCLMLERDFHWPKARIGYAIGATFLCIIPVKRLTAMASSFPVSFQFRVCSLLGLIGTMLLLRKAAALLGAPGWLFLLLSDLLIFSGAFLCDTQTFPLALQHSFAANESWLNTNTVAMVSQVFGAGAARLLGPWLLRHNLETHGREGQDVTAVVQMSACAVMVLAFELGIRPNLARGKGP